VNRTPAPVATAPVTDPRPARATRLALALAVLLAAVGTVLMVLRRDALPDPLAVHWGPEGADGFLSWSGATTMGAVLVLGIPLLLVGVSLLLDRSARHLLAGTAGGLAVVLAALTYGAFLGQQGSAEHAPSPGPALLVGSVLGLVVGLGLVRLGTPAPAPLPEHPAAPPADAPRLAVPEGTLLAWVGRLPRTGVLPLVLLVAGVAPTAYLAWTLEPYLWLVPAALGLLSGVLLSATVSVDRRGLLVRSLGVVTLVHVPLERVARADATTVRPLREFGGVGWRVAPDGTRALVMGSGPAVRISRHGEPDLVVGVSDAERVAATLNTLVDRAVAAR